MQTIFSKNSLIKTSIFITLLLVLFTAFFISETQAFDTEKLRTNIEAKTNIDTKDSNYKKYVEALSAYESPNGNVGVIGDKQRKQSTASGYYQMTEKTLFGEGDTLNKGVRGYIQEKYNVDIFEGKNAFRNGTCDNNAVSCPDKDRAMMQLSKDQQELVILAMYDMKTQNRGVDLKDLIESGDAAKNFEIYAKYHHGIRPSHVSEDTSAAAFFANTLNGVYGLGEGEKLIVNTTRSGYNISQGGNIRTIAFKNAIAGTLDAICARESTGFINFDGGICAGYINATPEQERSGFDALSETIQEGLNWVIGLAFMLAVAVLFWAGFLLLTGDQGQISKAKGILVNVVIGLILISSAWFLVDWIFQLFGVEEGFNFTSSK
jgi:hypothetical protein